MAREDTTPPTISPTRDRATLLDRYHQHTLICGSCRQALKTIQRLQRGLFAYFSVAIAIAAIVPNDNWLWLRFVLVSTGLLSLLVYGGLKYGLEPKFYFVDYVHAHR